MYFKKTYRNVKLFRCTETFKDFIHNYCTLCCRKYAVTGNHSKEHKCPVVHWTRITMFKRSQLD